MASGTHALNNVTAPEHRLSSSASRVYWAMTHVMVRRLTGASTPTWRDAEAVTA
jgi:hypothetical protein